MANPNIVSVATISAGTLGFNVTASNDALITAPADIVLKLNTILAANVDGTNSATLDLWLTGLGAITDSSGSSAATADANDATVYICKGLTIPPGATVSILEKSLYLVEADVLNGVASAASDIDLLVSFESIKD